MDVILNSSKYNKINLVSLHLSSVFQLNSFVYRNSNQKIE